MRWPWEDGRDGSISPDGFCVQGKTRVGGKKCRSFQGDFLYIFVCSFASWYLVYLRIGWGAIGGKESRDGRE